MIGTLENNFQEKAQKYHRWASDTKDAQRLGDWMQAFDAIGMGALIVGQSNQVTYYNHAFTKLHGASSRPIYGEDIFILFFEIFGKQAAEDLLDCMADWQPEKQQTQSQFSVKDNNQTFSVTLCTVSGGRECQASLAIIIQDISMYIQKLTEYQYMASHDPLTGIPNRWMLEEILDNAIGIASRSNSQLFIVYLDLNNFKRINDVYGHQTGDKFLQEFAFRIKNALRRSDTVCRIGGDEFVIVLHGGLNSVEKVFERISDALAEGIYLGEHRLMVDVSIGVSIYPQDGNSPKLLLEIADNNMYTRKEVLEAVSKTNQFPFTANKIEIVKEEI